GGGVAARARLGHAPRHRRALRAVHHRARDRQRLLGAERPGRPGTTLPEAGRGEGRRRRGGDVLRRRLHPRARIRDAAHRRLRRRHRPADDAAHRQREHPRRRAVPRAQARRLKRAARTVPAPPVGAAIAALGLTQIVGWGTTHYLPAILADSIAGGIGASPTLVLGAFSWGLLVAGASARASGRLMDRHGARAVMTIASLLVALGLLAMSFARGWPLLFIGWTLIGLAMRSILYDGAFAAMAALAGPGARRAISLLTLFGGLASTVFWPLGGWLDNTLGWRATLQVYALLNVVPCALLHT